MRIVAKFLLALSTLTIGCATVPDERDARTYYEQKDRQEAQRHAERAANDEDVIGAYLQLLGDRMNNNTPIEQARRMEDKTSADNRRRGINSLVKRPFGQRPPYTTRYGEIAIGVPVANAGPDPDYVVRATAIRALNRSRDKASTPIFIRALSDRSELVRLEAAKALNNVPDPAAAPRLTQMRADANEVMDVRIAAAEALRHYRTLEVARALVAVLDDRDFGIAWQARRSLERLTDAALGYDQAKWLAYLTGPAKPFG